MESSTLLIVRVLMGVFFSFILTKGFYPDATLPVTAGLAVVLVGLSYLFDYLRNRKSD